MPEARGDQRGLEGQQTIRGRGLRGTHPGHTGVHRPAWWGARSGSHLQGHTAQEGPRTQLPQRGPRDESRCSHIPTALPDAGTPSLTNTGAAAQGQPALSTRSGCSAPSAACTELREPARGFTIPSRPRGPDIGSGAARSLLAPSHGRACILGHQDTHLAGPSGPFPAG